MTLRRAAVALFCGALLLLAGCGSSSNTRPIPTDTANRLVALIGLADQRSQAGECLSAAAKVHEAQSVQIPTYVKRSVRQGIADGLDHLLSLIEAQCQRPQQTQTQTTQTQTTQTQTTTPTTTTPTTTTPTTTTPTTTTPSTTTPTTTTPTTTTGTSTGNGGTPTVTGTGATGAPGAGQGNQG